MGKVMSFGVAEGTVGRHCAGESSLRRRVGVKVQISE